ncbi:unnamed protein product [Cunninghamella blakesleeana]
MDNLNHSILQLVSAASQAIVVQNEDGGRSRHPSGKSIDEIYNTQQWSDIGTHTNEKEHITDPTNNIIPEHIQQLLAEAAGITSGFEEHDITDDEESILEAFGDEDNVDEEDKRTNESFMKRSIDETIKLVFNLPKMEKLEAEWPCYIVRSAIVPGYLYLTENHICFFASLPNNKHGYHKTGYMMIKEKNKMGKKYQRYYFELKDGTLAWYENSSDTYSPLGKIDLKYALSVRQSTKRKHGLRLKTMSKAWHFTLDTDTAVMEWLNTFQKAIFKAKNSGSSFKISLPFDNIFDIEYTDNTEFQQFLKIRVVDIEDSFVMDEYYFAYFPDIKSTFGRLKASWESSQKQLQQQENNYNLNPLNKSGNDDDSKDSNVYSYDNTPESPNESSPLSMSDLYDNAQPIIIPARKDQANSTDNNQKSSSLSRASSVSLVVANALAVPGALKEIFYPSSSTTNADSSKQASKSDNIHDVEQNPHNLKSTNIISESSSVSSSSDEEEKPMVDWLNEKKHTGMKLVNGLIGRGSGSGGTPSALYQNLNNDNDGEEICMLENDEADKKLFFHYGEIIDDRTLTNFRKYFVLPESEELLAVFRCSLLKTLPCYGKLYISTNHISFNSKRFGTKAKMIIPYEDVLSIQKVQSKGYIFHSISILTKKKKEIFLDFSSLLKRNSCFTQLLLQYRRPQDELLTTQYAKKLVGENKLLANVNQDKGMSHIEPPEKPGHPILSETKNNQHIYKKPEKSLHFTCITIGTRGDVQPYIALCKGLMKDGHRCRIATHDEFKNWIEEHNIEFRSVGGDPSELMRICVENNFFSVNFVVEGLKLFKVWIDELLDLSWKACQGTDILIESPSAMIGVHMAEKLRVPYFRAFPMPMTRTRSFPHPFATPNSPKGRLYNDMTYVLFDHAVWHAIASRTNSFRKNILGLPPTTYENLEIWKIPYLYSFSSSIVPSPLDWMDWVHCTGYWFLDNPQTGWKPDEKLTSFLESKDERPIVYIGFGSIIVSDPQEIIRIIVESVRNSNVRAIVSEGWSTRSVNQDGNNNTNNNNNNKRNEPSLLEQYPDIILSVKSVPHDWLFEKVRAVIHHGGAGTIYISKRKEKKNICTNN